MQAAEAKPALGKIKADSPGVVGVCGFVASRSRNLSSFLDCKQCPDVVEISDLLSRCPEHTCIHATCMNFCITWLGETMFGKLQPDHDVSLDDSPIRLVSSNMLLENKSD